jgi:hypothetical protein
MQHKWTPLDFCRTELSRTDTETYQKEVASGSIAPSPAMEAIVHSSLFIKANRRITYYISGNEIDIDIAKFSRLAEEWDPNLPNENTAYYLERLHDTVNKFREFFEPTAFERILSLDEMFGFSDEGIRILTRKVGLETVETKPDTEDYGIWLGETE